MTSKPSSTRMTGTSNTGVRRNLFHHHLSRRPTSTSTSTSSTTLQEAIHDDSNDIVEKDSNGNPQIRVPVLPPLDDDQAEEEEMGTERDSKGVLNRSHWSEVLLTPSVELEARMLELYKDRSLQPGDPAGSCGMSSFCLYDLLTDRFRAHVSGTSELEAESSFPRRRQLEVRSRKARARRLKSIIKIYNEHVHVDSISCTSAQANPFGNQPSVQPLSRWHLRLGLHLLRSRLGAPASKAHHTAHHIEQRVALSRDLDTKVHLADRRQRIVPASDLLDIGCVMPGQLLVQIWTTSLHSQQEQAEEVE